MSLNDESNLIDVKIILNEINKSVIRINSVIRMNNEFKLLQVIKTFFSFVPSHLFTLYKIPTWFTYVVSWNSYRHLESI